MATEVEPDRQSVSELVGGIIDDAQKLLRQQLDLFQVELKHDAKRYLTESIWLAASLVACLAGGIVLIMALGYFLSWMWPALTDWGGLAIAGGAVTILGAAMANITLKQIHALDPPLDQSVEGLKENIQWKKN